MKRIFILLLPILIILLSCGPTEDDLTEPVLHIDTISVTDLIDTGGVVSPFGDELCGDVIPDAKYTKDTKEPLYSTRDYKSIYLGPIDKKGEMKLYMLVLERGSNVYLIQHSNGVIIKEMN